MAEEKYFLVEVTETLQRTVKVKAKTIEDAERIAKYGYRECMVVLDAEEDLTGVSYSTTETTKDNNDSYYDATLVKSDNGNVYWETE